MAYGSHTLNRSYSVSSVEGVELRLHDKFKPTAKVTLPLQYEHKEPAVLKSDPEYDFKVENDFLEWIEGVKRVESEREKQRKHQQEGAEAAEAALQRAETVPDGNAPSVDGLAMQSSISQRPLLPPVAANLSNEILQPVPLANSIPKPASSGAAEGADNWADFEGRALDPFELAELETINDMEELRNVLQNTGPVAAPATVMNSQVQQSSPQPMDTQSEEPPSHMDHSDVTMVDAGISQVHMEANLNQVLFKPSQVEGAQIQTDRSDTPPSYQPREQSDNVQPNRTTAINAMPTPHLPPLQNDPFLSHSPLPPIGPSRENLDASLLSHNSVTTGTVLSSEHGDIPPPRYTPLDPALSVPVPAGSSSISLDPPPNYPMDGLHVDANFSPVNLSRYTPLPPPSSGPGGTSGTIVVEQADPTYDALSVEEKNFVNTIVSMGFPKGRTARAVKNVGNDDRQVLDLLCAVDTLCEQGYPEEKVELALNLQHNDQEQAKTFLSLWQRFEELGFKSEDIKRELILHGNNEERVLDTLTSSSSS